MVGRLVVIEGKQGGPKDKKEGSNSLGGEGREKNVRVGELFLPL